LAAILWDDTTTTEPAGVGEVAEAGIGAGGERAECGGVLPRARGMRSAVLRVEKAIARGWGGAVCGSEDGSSRAGGQRGARRGD
jgi:hypothetical protein